MDGEFKIQEEKKIVCCDAIGTSVSSGTDSSGTRHENFCICMTIGNVEIIAPLEDMDCVNDFCDHLKANAEKFFNGGAPKEVDPDILAQLLKILQNKE